MYFDVAHVIETGYKILSVSIENIKVGRINFFITLVARQMFCSQRKVYHYFQNLYCAFGL